MRTVEEIIAELKAIADDPKKAMEDYKKETGKGAVGIMPVYCPEEIVHASGYLPMGMWGAQKKSHLQSSYISATIRLLRYAVRNGITA